MVCKCDPGTALADHAETIFTSQVGDGHICIPLCLGLYAIFQPLPLPEFMSGGLLFISAVAGIT